MKAVVLLGLMITVCYWLMSISISILCIWCPGRWTKCPGTCLLPTNLSFWLNSCLSSEVGPYMLSHPPSWKQHFWPGSFPSLISSSWPFSFIQHRHLYLSYHLLFSSLLCKRWPGFSVIQDYIAHKTKGPLTISKSLSFTPDRNVSYWALSPPWPPPTHTLYKHRSLVF